MESLSTHGNLLSVSGGATRAGTGGSRGHLEKTLAEVDGLFAGFVYIEATEPRPTSPSFGGSGSQNGLSKELQVLRDEESLTNRIADAQQCSINSDSQACKMAWSSIRTIRDRMETLWGYFTNVAANVENVAINRILVDYQDAKGLRHTGAIALRNIVSGPTPTDLCKIFAFCCLSHVVSHLLYARNRLVQADILAGVSQWLYALERDDEREAFKLLVQHLWPEAQHHLHSMVSATPFQFDTINPSLISLQPTEMPTTSADNFVCSQQDFDFSFDLLDISNTDMGSLSPNWQDFSQDLSYPSTSPWTSTQLPATYDTSTLSYNEQSDPSRSIVSINPQTPHRLQQTSVFKAVTQFIQENSEFWYNLAGCSLVSKDFRTCLAWSQERLSRKMEIQNSFIRPLSSEVEQRDLVSRGIVNIVEAFVERGLLQEREEIELYMERVGTFLFNDQDLFREFCDWIHGVSQRSVPTTQSSAAQKIYSCVQCRYTSDRSNNVKRHTYLLHDRCKKGKRTSTKSRKS